MLVNEYEPAFQFRKSRKNAEFRQCLNLSALITKYSLFLRWKIRFFGHSKTNSKNPILINTAVKRLRMRELLSELSFRTKTEEKYISERLHKALEKRVNKITRG